MSAAAGFMNGLAAAKRRTDDNARQDRYLAALESGALQRRQVERPGASQTPKSSGRVVATDPEATDLDPYARAFLNAIAAPESDGAYNVRYSPNGPVTFEETGQHPRIYEKGPHGPSSAAGRYQFTAQTWDDMGGGPFTRAAQDARAWKLAQQRYAKVAGGDLTQVLKTEGLTDGVLDALSPTWAGFGGARRGDAITAYNQSYERYAANPRRSVPSMESQPASQPARRTVAPQDKNWGWVKDIFMGVQK